MHSLQSLKTAFETRLDSLFPEGNSLNTLARYSLFASAKRVRPLLLMATATCYGSSVENSLDPACAIEMIHTYSLIHDDLPCMDNDDLRRGKPTLHKAYSEWQALLTGDYLLTFAFEVVSNSALAAEEKVALIQTISKQAGATGMIGGQMIDLLCVQQEIPIELLEEMHKKKTGALFVAAITCGAIIGHAPSSDYSLLEQIATSAGLAFQLQDDLFDYTSTTAVLGKPVLSDKKKHKPTAVSLLGIKKTEELFTSCYSQVFSLLDKLSCSTPLLYSLFQSLFDRKM